VLAKGQTWPGDVEVTLEAAVRDLPLVTITRNGNAVNAVGEGESTRHQAGQAKKSEGSVSHDASSQKRAEVTLDRRREQEPK
jgi:hypothetical protein